MTEPLTITLKTLTPLWTGGADQTSDRLHVTGLMGSLRWWYEALVRGLGGYACDPTSENPDARCAFDSKAYEKARAEKRDDAEAIREGLKKVCPVCHLFGATGWARLFQLQPVSVPTTELHFRTSLPMNKSWLKRVFGGESQSIDARRVPYGNLIFQIVTRRYDTDYALSQLGLVFRFAEMYGGLGARLQHGFGQVGLTLPSKMINLTMNDAPNQLVTRLKSEGWRSHGPQVETPFTLSNFLSLDYVLSGSSLSDFTRDNAHIGNPQKGRESSYLPCAFDLRYKGKGKFGMRRWLEDPEGSKRWSHNNANVLMGISKKKGEPDNEDDRQASRLCFGMPYQVSDVYRLRIFGFAPSKLLMVEALRDLSNEYMRYAFDAVPSSVALGKDLISKVQGG